MTLPADLSPILPGFHPDPSICRVGDTYYLATSSFEYRPGVPLFSSTNLRDWQPVGHALSTPDHFPEDAGWPSHGIYAPTLRHHDGRFWLTTTNVTPDAKEQMILHAPKIEGPWSVPVMTKGMEGIDPDLTWDGDACYLTWTTSDPANPAILQARIDPLTAVALEEPRVIWRGTGLAYPEAPHFYRKNGWWYLMLAEGGTERGHAITMARGPRIRGPFEGCPTNPIFSHRSLLHPIQNTGHGDLIERPDGSWALVFLAVRPKGGSPGYHVNGRESFLAGIDWTGDWPVVVPFPEPVTRGVQDFHDDFSATELHGRWISPGIFPRAVVQSNGSGCVLAPSGLTDRPSMLLARVTDDAWVAEMVLDAPGSGATFLLRMDDDSWAGIEIGPKVLSGVLSLPGLRHCGGVMDRPEGPLHLRMVCAPGCKGIGFAPDHVVFDVATTSGWQSVLRIDGRYLSTDVTGGFTGRVWGVRTKEAPVCILRATYRRSALTAVPPEHAQQ